MYHQLVTPNLDPVVYQYGEVLTDWYGWCLAVAWTAFNGHITNPTAWSAWTNSVKYKHTDALPSDVYVLVWFSGYSGSGHVAIYKDGQVWSSPDTHKPYMDILSSIAQVEEYYHVTYVGWSEDIGGVRVVEPITEGEDMPKILNTGQARTDYLLFGIELPGDSPALLNAVGADELEFIKGMGPQVQNNLKARDKAIADLQAQVKQLGATPVAGLDSDSKAKLDQVSQDVGWLRSLLSKIFK